MGNQNQKPMPQPPTIKQSIKVEAKLQCNITCPNCFLQFIKNSPLSDFNTHMKMCLSGLTVQSQKQQVLNRMTTSKHSQQFKEFIYEKVFLDEDSIRYSWKQTKKKHYDDDIWQIPKQFQQKLAWFRSNLERMRISWEEGCDWIRINKNQTLMTSIEQVKYVNMWKQLKVQIIGDRVLDAGGLLRQWIHLISKQIFDPELSLFMRANTEELAYKISNYKNLDLEFGKQLFGLLGTVIGKAIFQKIPLQTYLDRSIIRQICGQQITLSDIHSYDKSLYDSWKYMMDNTIEEDMDIYFTINEKVNSQILQVDLVQDGSTKLVNNQNKQEYVKLCIQKYCVNQVKPFLDSLRKSLYKIIPQDLFTVFQPNEMAMILYGVPFIDVEEWKNNTEYNGAYTRNHRTIKWFWEIVRSFQQQKLGKLLHFCTGSSRTPIRGFAKLQTNRGNTSRFVIESSLFQKENPYPKGHTCFNRLQLPVYPTKQLVQLYVQAIVNNDLDGVYGLD